MYIKIQNHMEVLKVQEVVKRYIQIYGHNYNL